MRNFLGSTPMARYPPIILASNQFRHLTINYHLPDATLDVYVTPTMERTACNRKTQNNRQCSLAELSSDTVAVSTSLLRFGLSAILR
jgi:hypothetical protein